MGEVLGPLLPRRWLFRDSDVCLTRPALAFTAYFLDSAEWASTHAPERLDTFVQLFGEPLRVFRTSRAVGWRELPPDRRDLARHLRWEGRVRHQLMLEVADHADTPSLAFRYREVDRARSGQCGHLQLVLPIGTPPGELLAQALELCNLAPVTVGVGGPSLVTSRRYERQAFSQAYRASKRFLGLDVPWPEAGSRVARRGLPSVGWLTYLSRRRVERIGLDLDSLGETPGVSCVPTKEGVLIKAGEEPELGDVNRMEYPHALAAVARALDEQLEAHRPFPGAFSEPEDIDDEPPDHTTAWLHRFAEPDRWT